MFLFHLKLYSQQCSFTQLVEMTNEKSYFEIKMIKSLNQIYKKDKNISYVYHTINGEVGATSSLPTNDIRYEPKYQYDSTHIYSDSEIEKYKLDESHEIRNKLIKEDRLINKTAVDSCSFIKNKITSLVKCESTEIIFAENYNSEENIASTWYTWEQKYYKKILVNSQLFRNSYKMLTIEFVKDDDYKRILDQIIASSKYIDTYEEYGNYKSKYQFNSYLITSERREKGLGGIITIRFEQK
jgi:hypothetical protein